MGRVAIVSFRLGLTDGVSIVAETWSRAFAALGWSTVLVAGEGPVDRLVPGLELDALEPPSARAFEDATDDADLVVVENLLTIPMNLPASRIVAAALRGRPTILHHHDPAWQRERFANVTELPPDDPAWRHVTINDLTRRQLADRDIEATTIYNGFDVNPPTGHRAPMRAALGVADAEPLIVHPVRAIARKNLAAALAVAEAVGATYWITGAVEEDFAPEFEQLMAGASTRVIHRSASSPSDLYAAADLVVFPSHWEGFGNPPIEAAIHRRPVLVGNYPVADELRALGFDWPRLRWPDADSVGHRHAVPDPALLAEARRALDDPDRVRLEHNRRVAVRELGQDRLIARLQYVLDQAGWRP